MAEVDIDEVETRGVIGPCLVGVRVDPPITVLHAALLCIPGLVEPEVDKVGTLLRLGDARGRGVETGPGVKYEGTIFWDIGLLDCSVDTVKKPKNLNLNDI